MDEDCEIRRLTIEDAALLEQSEAFDNEVDPAQARAFLEDARHEIVAAIVSGQVIGFASGVVLLHPDKPPAMFISEIGVEKAFQRRGIGERLIGALLKLARERGCRGVWLATEQDNAAARALYRRAQARETGGIVVYDWDGAMGP